MRKIIINGGKKLNGKIHLSGGKNASLPILISTLLFDEKVKLSNVPDVFDVSSTEKLLVSLGSFVERDSKGNFIIDNSNITSTTATKELVSNFKASFLVFGPLLTKYKTCKVALPGGCKIGARPVDIYLKTMREMGAIIEETGEYIIASAEKLIGAEIILRLPSVGATENLIMASVLAEGKTVINNAAQEPEVVDLSNFLIKAGARIKGAGTNKIEIIGVEKLHPVDYTIMCDRIEALSYIIAGLITDGDLTIEGVDFDYVVGQPIELLTKTMGANIQTIDSKTIRVIGNKADMMPADVKTDFFPGFPTDGQPIIMSLMTTINGVSNVNETIFEDRFHHIEELNKMGANIILQPSNNPKDRTATINGSLNCLKGANVTTHDLRAGMALVLAGLSAKGTTAVDEIYHIERGYEDLVGKLSSCGADIKKVIDE